MSETGWIPDSTHPNPFREGEPVALRFNGYINGKNSRRVKDYMVARKPASK